MKAKPMLDKWELQGLERLEALENRVLVEHRIPGLEGSLFQDLGDSPAKITLEGSLQGDEVKLDFLQQLRDKFKEGKPVPFVADITTATDVQDVLIEDINVSEAALDPDTIFYSIVLKEFTAPPPDEAQLASQLEAGIKEEADSRFQSTVQDLKAESALKDLGIDAEKAGSLIDNIDSGKLNDLLDGLDPAGQGIFSDLLDAIPLDSIKDLAEALGISLPPLGYKSVEEVFYDLLGGASQMLAQDVGSWAGSIGATFAKILAKLLVTLVTGEISDCEGLANTFKDAVAGATG